MVATMTVWTKIPHLPAKSQYSGYFMLLPVREEGQACLVSSQSASRYESSSRLLSHKASNHYGLHRCAARFAATRVQQEMAVRRRYHSPSVGLRTELISAVQTAAHSTTLTCLRPAGTRNMQTPWNPRSPKTPAGVQTEPRH